jgi:hypothetical protein
MPAELIPSTIPEGATAASLLKLCFHDASTMFNFFCTLLSKQALERIEGHSNNQASTFPLTPYTGEARRDVPFDEERVRNARYQTIAANLALGGLEATVAADAQRAAALLTEIFLLLSHSVSEIEANRIASNQGSYALLNRRTLTHQTAIPQLQGPMMDAEKQQLQYNVLMNKATAVVGTGAAGAGLGQFFRSGGSDSLSPLSAPLDPTGTLSAALPYDPYFLSSLSSLQPPKGSPISLQTPTPQTPSVASNPPPVSTSAPSTTHTSDPPNPKIKFEHTFNTGGPQRSGKPWTGRPWTGKLQNRSKDGGRQRQYDDRSDKRDDYSRKRDDRWKHDTKSNSSYSKKGRK